MYSDQERRVFRYHDGTANVYGDPLAVQRRLTQALDGDPNKAIADAGSDDPAVWPAATAKLAAAVRNAFDMPAFDRATGKGATEAHCRDALAAFLGWMEKNAPPAAS